MEQALFEQKLFEREMLKRKIASIGARALVSILLSSMDGNFLMWYIMVSWVWVFVRIFHNWLLGIIATVGGLIWAVTKYESLNSTSEVVVMEYILFFGLVTIDVINIIRFFALTHSIQKEGIELRKLSREKLREYTKQPVHRNGYAIKFGAFLIALGTTAIIAILYVFFGLAEAPMTIPELLENRVPLYIILVGIGAILLGVLLCILGRGKRSKEKKNGILDAEQIETVELITTTTTREP